MELASPSLMAHQVAGVEFLLTAGSGILAFEQGLGKTLVAIEAFRRLRSRGEAETMVVLCPNSLKLTWARELTRFAPDLRTDVVGGDRADRRRVLASTTAPVVVINYESARAEIIAIRALLRRVRTVLVLDESHYVKNHRSLTATAVEHFVQWAPYRWLLTGTPVTNAPTDLYPQVCVAAGGRPFGSYAGFEATYGGRDHRQGDLEELNARIRPYLMRRTKEECLDLPEKTFVDIVVELPGWQRRLYEAARDSLAHELGGMTEEEFRRFIPGALTRLLRLSQIASNPALVFPGEARTPGKFAQLDSVVSEIVAAGRKVLVWSSYVETVRSLQARFARFGAAALSGETPADARQVLATKFQEDPALRVLVANPAAAGTGFTLTAATHAVYETLNWRYDQYAQSQDRNHRIGQRAPVTYVRLLAADTVEFAVVEALQRKAEMAGAILGDVPRRKLPEALTRDAFIEMLKSGLLPE